MHSFSYLVVLSISWLKLLVGEYVFKKLCSPGWIEAYISTALKYPRVIFFLSRKAFVIKKKIKSRDGNNAYFESKPSSLT